MIISERKSVTLEPGNRADDAVVAAIKGERGNMSRIAEATGFGRSVISQWANGNVALPERTCRIICEAAGCTELFEEAMR